MISKFQLGMWPKRLTSFFKKNFYDTLSRPCYQGLFDSLPPVMPEIVQALFRYGQNQRNLNNPYADGCAGIGSRPTVDQQVQDHPFPLRE